MTPRRSPVAVVGAGIAGAACARALATAGIDVRLLQLDTEPAWTVTQRWSFARPAGSREQPFHLGAARVGLCGDAWGSPRVETAWRSGHLLGEEVARQLA